MERKIGKLGLHPIKANSIGHGGTPGQCGGPEFYLKDSLSLNIVYSVYHQPKTRDEIAEELGVTPVFIEEKIKILEDNSFLVKQAGSRYTTYVQFTPETFSLEQRETVLKKQLAAAELLAGDYANSVRAAVSDMNDVYIPGGNRQLLEAAAIFYGIMHHCQIPIDRDLSRYQIKTLDGGCYYAFVDIPAVQSDTDYKPTLHLPSYDACGNMYRSSEIYPIYSWSMDTRYSSRLGRWKNNLAADYEYLYEFISGAITDNQANAEKFGRLRERQYITEYGKVNIMMVKGNVDDFSAKIPQLDETLKRQIADNALEMAEITAKAYPPQMRDIVVSFDTSYFISSTVALMVMDILYGNGTFRALTENEKVTSNLIMFSDKLPNE